MWISALPDADAAYGGKARALARLCAAGLPVPPGFALAGGAFHAVLGDLAGTALDAAGHALADAAERIATSAPDPEVLARAAPLGLLAVRSSATLEDGAAGAAAGVFVSCTAVPPADAWAAIRAVWASALAPVAIAYARRRGAAGALPIIGVIVQRFVAGTPTTVYTRAPSGAAEVWVQRGDAIIRHARDAATPPEEVALALAAEAAIDAAATGADVELVRDAAGAWWVVQARPIVRAAPPPPRTAPPPILLAPLADGARWTWDVAHNPDPLSPAQAGLVAHVAEIAPWRLRVCAGYLYSAARPEAPAAGGTDDAALAALEAAMLAALDGDDGAAADDVAAALARYAEFYARWAALSVALAAARRAAGPALGARPSAVEATLLAAARGELTEEAAIARLAPLAPAWDVAAATYGERPEHVRAAIARARAAGLPPARSEPPDAAAHLADLAERDDVAFARAQGRVRRALLARARALGIDADDVFWLPLTEVASAVAFDRDQAHRQAAAARAAAARAARWDMPLVVGGAPPAPGAALHGVGHGGRVVGRVVRYASLASAVGAGRGDVVVTRAVTPALAVHVTGCAAIVSETGGLLDHGAALARELGVPCVVGCHGAWGLLADGDLVEVDGDAGRVARIEPTSAR